MMLAIDTATDQASVALAGAEGAVVECSWQARGNHSRHLTRVIRDLLDVAGMSLEAVTSLAVATGPGSFSGLRVGLSEAKAIAWGRGLPLAPIGTLDVVAFQAECCGHDVWAALPAGRGQLYVAHYQGRGESWRRVWGPAIKRPDEVSDIETGSLVAGEGAAALAEAARAKGRDVRLHSPALSLRRAGFLAELGKRYLETAGPAALDDLEPLYLRRSAAEETRQE